MRVLKTYNNVVPHHQNRLQEYTRISCEMKQSRFDDALAATRLLLEQQLQTPADCVANKVAKFVGSLPFRSPTQWLLDVPADPSALQKPWPEWVQRLRTVLPLNVLPTVLHELDEPTEKLEVSYLSRCCSTFDLSAVRTDRYADQRSVLQVILVIALNQMPDEFRRLLPLLTRLHLASGARYEEESLTFSELFTARIRQLDAVDFDLDDEAGLLMLRLKPRIQSLNFLSVWIRRLLINVHYDLDTVGSFQVGLFRDFR